MSNHYDHLLDAGSYKIAFDDPGSNWDIYINDHGTAISIAKKPSCVSTHFGDVNYIKRLMTCGYWTNEMNHITDHGRACFTGLYSQLMTDSKGRKFSILRWSK